MAIAGGETTWGGWAAATVAACGAANAAVGVAAVDWDAICSCAFFKSDLILHRQDYLFHLGVGLLSKDSLYPSGCRDYLFHGMASKFLDFCRQGAIDSTEKSVNGMAFCCFLVVSVQALSELLGFASELQYFFGASFKLLKGCPGFVSYGADAQAR